jgi:hypothetical protein
MRRYVALLVGIVAVCGLATWWLIADDQPDPARPPAPTQAEQIIKFCSKPAHKQSPLCSIDPADEDAVGDAVERIIDRQTTGPTIIERRTNDDDDDDRDSQVIVVPSSRPPASSAPRPTPAPTTQPPARLPIELPEVPAMPVEVPDLGLPLLP